MNYVSKSFKNINENTKIQAKCRKILIQNRVYLDCASPLRAVNEIN